MSSKLVEMADDKSFVDVDLEQQVGEASSSTSPSQLHVEHQDLQAALADVAECRARLEALGEPPEHELVEEARAALASLDASLAAELERLHNSALPPSMDPQEWAALLDQKEQELQSCALKSKLPYQAVLQTDELYRCYELLLKDAEQDMLRLCEGAESSLSPQSQENEDEEESPVNEDVTRILSEAKEAPVMDVKLCGRGLTRIPDAFGRISTMVSIDLSNNRLKLLSDSIGGLMNLETLNLENNNLESLPDSIGLLKNLKVLNVSSNKLTAFPDSIIHCSSLVTLTANLNQLSYLPTQIGYSLENLEQLSLQWNKLRTLPASICNLKSLKCLEVKFNHLKALPAAIGNLTKLEVLDASCNFMDLQTVPETIGDLVSLVEINLSCNQIKRLPYSFGRLENLKKIHILDNPLVVPPLQVAEAGSEAIMVYMKDQWQKSLEEENVAKEETQNQSKWLPDVLSGPWVNKLLSAVGYRPSESSSTDELLEQQL